MQIRTISLLIAFLLFQTVTALAQENSSGIAEGDSKVESVLSEPNSDKLVEEQGNQAARMSVVNNEEIKLSASNDLLKQTSNTAIAAGSCIVVDMFVRQFCNANPNDISCQFQ